MAYTEIDSSGLPKMVSSSMMSEMSRNLSRPMFLISTLYEFTISMRQFPFDLSSQFDSSFRKHRFMSCVRM